MENIITETSTIHQLKSTVNVFFDTPREKNSRQVEVFNLFFIPYVDNKQLLVKANTRSNNNTYKTSILFNDVKYVKKDTRYAVEILANNDKYYIYSIKKNKSDVLVSCTCLDFYYTFSIWNQKDFSLFGDPPKPYIKKTNRPLRNPYKQPGVCKHILRLSDELIGKGILK
jgi:hypothetical protein